MNAFSRRSYNILFLLLVPVLLILTLQTEPPAKASDIASKASLIEVDHLGGLAQAVAGMGEHLAAGVGRRLVLFTLASSNRLEPIGSTPPLAGDVEAIVAKGSIVYVSAGQGGLYAIDASDPAHPVIRWHTGQTSEGMVVRENILAVASGQQGLILYQLEQPLQPKQLSVVSYSGSYVRDAALYGDYVYVVSYAYSAGKSFLGIVNITDLQNPVIVDEINADEYISFRRVFVQNQRLYITAHSQGLIIYSLADPAQLQKIGMYDKLYYAEALHIEGDYAYVSDEGMHVLDVRDPADIRQVTVGEDNFQDISRFGPHLAAAMSEHGLHLVNSDKLPQIDDTVLYESSSYIELLAMENDTLVGVVPFPGWQSISRIEALSLKHPYAPRQGAAIWIPEDIWDLFSSDNLVYVAASDGLHILQIGQDAKLHKKGFASLSYPFSVYVRGEYAYLSSPNEGLTVINVGDPNDPRRVTTLEDIRGQSITGNGDYLYTWESDDLGDGNQRLLVLSLADESKPTIVGSLGVEDKYCDLVTKETTIYCFGGNDLFIYDASNPSQPRLVNEQSTSSDELYDPLIAGDHLYTRGNNGELIVLDIGQNPFAPTEIVRTRLGNQFSSVVVAQETVYVSGYSSGLTTLVWTTEESLTVDSQGAEFSMTDGHYTYLFTKETFPDFGDFDFADFIHTAMHPNKMSNLPPALPTSLAFNNRALKYGALGQSVPPGSYDLFIRYENSDLGLVDEESLVLYYYDGGQWRSEPSARVDIAANQVVARPQHFGLFMLAGRASLQSFIPVISQNNGHSPPEILGIEVTQGTQTMSNDVPLVAYRPTLARVHVKVTGERPLDGVSMLLEGTREGIELPGSPLVQENWAVFPEYDRGKLTHSFNFKLPASWLKGKVKLSARFGSQTVSSPSATNVVFSDVPPLDVVLVPVEAKDTRYDITCPAPKVDAEAYKRETEVLFPVPEVEISVSAPVMLEADDLLDMVDKVASLKAADGAPNHVVYYGVIGRESEEGDCLDGPGGYAFGRLRVSAGSNVPSIMAHETGHNLGLLHAPCGNAPNPDERYPYAGGSIGTYGYDVINSQIWSPAGSDYAKDFMSYCVPEWVSDYNYRKLYEDQKHNGKIFNQDTVQRTLLVRTIKRGDEDFQLRPVYQLETIPTNLPDDSDLKIELLSNSGQVLGSYPLHVVHTEEEEYEMEVAVAAIEIPQAWPIAKVRLIHNEAVVAERDLSFQMNKTASSEIVTQIDESGFSISNLPTYGPVLIRFQAAGTNRWTTYAVDLTEEIAFLPADSLPEDPGTFEVVTADRLGPGSAFLVSWTPR